MKPSTVKNILFITSTRLGDAVLSTGLLDYLLKTYPNAEFTIACGPVAAGLFDAMPRRKKTLIMEKQRYDLHWINLWRCCVLRSWDLVVDIRGSALGFFLYTKKRVIVRGGRVSGKRIEHLAKSVSLSPAPLPVMWMNEAAYLLAKQYLPNKTYIALAPTANWSGKIWAIERFIALAEKIKHWHPEVQFAVFYGKDSQEYEMVKPLLQSALPIIDVGGGFGLVEVAAMLSRCQGFVGNDSGLMHLAAACGIPVVGLFGPSKASEYAPSGQYTRAVVAEGKEGHASMGALPVEKVFLEFKQLLEAREHDMSKENN